MEDKFYNRDFEQFVKSNADQYRMFPSEKVWKNIHHNLHTRRKWYGIGVGLLLLSIGAVTGVMVSNPNSKQNIANYNTKIIPARHTASENLQIPFKLTKTEELIVSKTKNDFSSAETFQNSLFSNNQTSPTDNTDGNEIASQFTSSILPVLVSINSMISPLINEDIPSPNLNLAKPLVVKNVPVTSPSLFETALPSSTVFLIDETDANHTITEKKPEPIVSDSYTNNNYPLTIESVVNSYQFKKSRKKLKWELFLTPTVTYRRLSENKDFINAAQSASNTLSYTAFTDINSLVKHKPDIGFQFGLTTSYPLFKNLNIVGGLQFNVSKYDIRAYQSNSEIATIALNSGAGANSVSTTSNYRNFSGTKLNWLRNFYFSASAPIGLDLKLAGNKRNTVGIVGTIQPTYILGDQAYLITTDYKNYAEMPSLVRKFNTNVGLEVYGTFNTGKTKWKIGPQARYQTRSSFKALYPIKEHLFDFGIKLGIQLH